MTQLDIPGYWGDEAQEQQVAEPVQPVEQASLLVRRSSAIPFWFSIPVMLSGVAYAMGGQPFLCDLAFVFLTALCAILLVIELVNFSERLGIGAILIYGGVLIWFCHDYATTWFHHNFNQVDASIMGITPEVVSRAFFYHCIFILGMVVAFRFQILRWVDKVVVIVPEPSSTSFYLALTLVILLFGWSAFLAAEDPIFIAVPKGALWFILGPVQFSVWRSGNMNYNWGGYVAQILQVGQLGGVLGAAYAILVAKNFFGKLFGWFVWGYWFLFGVAGERRGEIAFVALPVLGFLFIKITSGKNLEQRRRNLWALLLTSIVGIAVLYSVQWETANRSGSDEVDLFRAAGNTMFSEGLRAWTVIPEFRDYAYDTFPGAGIVRPMFDTLFWFVIDPIPRALWNDKPIESFGLWYSSFISGDNRWEQTGGLIGSTVSTGAVGYWYLRYGPAGVIEGAFLYGWMFGVAERALRRAQFEASPMKILFALAFATFMFRSYRDLWWHNLYPVMIGGVVFTIVIKMFFNAPKNEASSNSVPAL